MSKPFDLGPMPDGRVMETLDERSVSAPVDVMFSFVRDVENWPAWLTHYRYVRFRSRNSDGGGIVEMSANRPFGIVNWPTWWLSEMSVDASSAAVRFRHIGGVTARMDVEWKLTPTDRGAHVRLLHVWDGPRWPLIGTFAARAVIGPVFIHGIASRTLEGLSLHAEQSGPGTPDSFGVFPSSPRTRGSSAVFPSSSISPSTLVTGI